MLALGLLFLVLGMRPMLTRMIKRQESGRIESTVEAGRKPNP
jgi:hypothetical protein